MITDEWNNIIEQLKTKDYIPMRVEDNNGDVHDVLVCDFERINKGDYFVCDSIRRRGNMILCDCKGYTSGGYIRSDVFSGSVAPDLCKRAMIKFGMGR